MSEPSDRTRSGGVLALDIVTGSDRTLSDDKPDSDMRVRSGVNYVRAVCSDAGNEATGPGGLGPVWSKLTRVT